MPAGVHTPADQLGALQTTVADLIKRVTALEHVTHGEPQEPHVPIPQPGAPA